MIERVYIGIDNGVTGSIGIIRVSDTQKLTAMISAPTKSEQNYTKAKGNITRIRFLVLRKYLAPFRLTSHVILERPMVNPSRFRATTSALRALESTLCVLESLEMSHSYIDSKEWQKELLPKGIKGTSELKKASLDIGCRIFPNEKAEIIKHGDADGLLIAEFCRRLHS